ncbi:ornithine carbamoyltransferase [Jimgerdemannia flammicorona]|uniref:ornithine carbamoyltransferase n=1 Tax=Jimgerdemannia flammicorona TaxID=994334 RepID=A0A433DHH3_9FUNG|nr:ornithine carbamoyltransferase [Jimgerdemannia flammicorona]
MFSLPRPLLTRTFIGATTRRHYASATRPSPVHLLTLADLTAGQIHELLVSSAQHKRDAKHTDKPPPQPLRGKTMAIMFSKRSTRTRVATESALACPRYVFGIAGYPAGRERVAARHVHRGVEHGRRDHGQGLWARGRRARHSTVPIINALSAKYHPTQLLADLLTLHESATNSLTPTSDYSAHKTHPSKTLPGLRVAWVGDGNNILNEMLVSMPKLGVHLAAACPNGYTPDPDVVQIAKEDGKRTGAEVLLTTVPEEAVKSADVIVTDTWVSMGQETEKQRRLKDFAGYQITMDLARRGGANSGWKFMHCLPRKPEEVDDEVFYSDRSLVFPEAENRKWTILAAIDALLVRGRF